jgi:hypothetical protein
MAKAILKYDISDPEDSQDFKRAVKSFDMAMALWDIIQLRKKMENRFEAQDNTNNDVFEEVSHRELKLGAFAMTAFIYMVDQHLFK